MKNNRSKLAELYQQMLAAHRGQSSVDFEAAKQAFKNKIEEVAREKNTKEKV